MDARSGRRGSRVSRDRASQSVGLFGQRLSRRFGDPESQGKPRRICGSLCCLRGRQRAGEESLVTSSALLERARL